MKLRYRCPAFEARPAPGHILMGHGARVRRAYRVLGTRAGAIADGEITMRLTVESMSAAAGRAEIALGHPHWGIHWDNRGPRP